MTSMFSFIDNAGAEVHGDRILALGETPADFATLNQQATVSPLGDRGVLAVTGADVVKLLQGQLTCDMAQLAEAGSLKGALCDSKGRMVSSFVCIQSAADQALLVMHRDLVTATLDTLKKYAPFYKVTLADATDQYRVFGLHRAAASAEAFSGRINDQLRLVVCSADGAAQCWQQLIATARATGDTWWLQLLIDAGEGEVKPQTQGEFIPQMLNFQHTGAISFRKGCYTGQEIVARMQYLGKLKRRMYHLQVPGAVAINPGDVVNGDGKASIGTVVMATDRGEIRDVLAVLTEEAAHAERLEIGAYTGAVTLAALPYDSAFQEQKP